MTTTIVQKDGLFFQRIHPFVDTGWIKFHRSLVYQVVANVDSLSTLKAMLLFLEQTTDKRDRDVPADLSVRKLAKTMKISPTSAAKAIEELLGIGIIRLTRPGDRSSPACYELNRDFELYEPVEYISSATAGVPTIDTPEGEGVPTIDTPEDEGVPTVGTPKGKNKEKVYQRLVRSLEEDIREEEGEKPPLAPLSATEDEFHASARVYEAAAYAGRLARMSPDERRRVEARERMVEMLSRVTDATVKANRGRLESVADKIDEFTPEQIWRGFGDPNGWWWQEWYKGKSRGQKPTLYDVQEFAGRAAGWHPPVGAGKGVPQAETAWNAVRRAIGQFGRYRQGELLEALDEVTRATVKAVGLGRLLDVDPEDRFAAGQVQRTFKQEYAAQAQRLGGVTQAAD